MAQEQINESTLTSPDYKMYDDILPEFAKYMRKELAANFEKGDRNGPKGWLAVDDNKFWISELYYHVGKLQSAFMNNDTDRVKENCADIANLAMMVLDVKIDLLKNYTSTNDDDAIDAAAKEAMQSVDWYNFPEDLFKAGVNYINNQNK